MCGDNVFLSGGNPYQASAPVYTIKQLDFLAASRESNSYFPYNLLFRCLTYTFSIFFFEPSLTIALRGSIREICAFPALVIRAYCVLYKIAAIEPCRENNYSQPDFAFGSRSV